MGKLLSLSLLSLLSLSTFLITTNPVTATLSTSGRWIVDGATGDRVKLACVNWVAHLEVMVAEGLSKQPVDAISKNILSIGFNCVRLTWPIYLVTNDSLVNVTVRQSFQSLGLSESISGLQANNPSIVDLPLLKAFQAVVSSIANNNVMIVLDNHITTPGWCCSNSDGNGFFGDKYFDPDLWLTGLTRMATLFRGIPNVVGMSLRNELRGPKQNVNDWYKYMEKGAEAVHSANPDVLVILSGLNFDKDLSYVKNRPVSLTFKGKLVFEMHWYGFSDGDSWKTGNPNEVCGRVVRNMMRYSGYLLEQGFPLFVSEFGIDTRGTNVNDNRYMDCFLGKAAELDWDWALWTYVGSYYLREGTVGLNKVYGVMDWNWCDIRNSTYLRRISSIQSPFQGPGLTKTKPHKVIFHPRTGLCILRKGFMEAPRLGPCSESESWSYTPQKTLTLKGTNYCIQAVAAGKPAKLGMICSDSGVKWEMISDSRMHLSSTVHNGTTVCMDVDPGNNNIVTNPCKCLSKDNTCDPSSQWFSLVNSTRTSKTSSFSRTTSFFDSPIKNALLEYIGPL